MTCIVKYCSKCGKDIRIVLEDVFSSGKKRVVCGPCRTVLMTEDELEAWYRTYHLGSYY